MDVDNKKLAMRVMRIMRSCHQLQCLLAAGQQMRLQRAIMERRRRLERKLKLRSKWR
jgi:hypothetical protein